MKKKLFFSFWHCQYGSFDRVVLLHTDKDIIISGRIADSSWWNITIMVSHRISTVQPISFLTIWFTYWNIDDATLSFLRLGLIHLAFSVGSKEDVDKLTRELEQAGYAIFSGPRTTGDGYYESCIIGPENNLIEI